MVNQGFTVPTVGLIETTYCYLVLILRIARDGQAEKLDILAWLKYKRVVFTLTENRDGQIVINFLIAPIVNVRNNGFLSFANV